MVLGNAFSPISSVPAEQWNFQSGAFRMPAPRHPGDAPALQEQHSWGSEPQAVSDGWWGLNSDGEHGHHLPTVLPGLAIYSQLLFYGFSVWFSDIILPFPVSDSVESGPSLSVIEI